MRLSKYFVPTLKEAPAETSIISHELMLRAGMIKQIAAGIYNWLPFGLSVLSKVEVIIRQEMNNIDASELLIPSIQPVSLWKASGRYGVANDLNNEILRMKDRTGQEMIFTPTAEEAIVDIIASGIQSYKSFPISVYQISWKFRDEIRPRYGVMRSREFLMKDAYSFHMTKECALKTYEDMLKAYLKIYCRLNLVALPVAANTGTIGGDYSHEFHVLADTGESTIYYEKNLEEKLKSNEITLSLLQDIYAMEEEKHNPELHKAHVSEIVSSKGIEVGHIFYLGNKYSKAMSMKVQYRDGSLKHPEMGCYGIGVSRLVGALIEANHDEKGIIWPDSVAPFKFMILSLKTGDTKCNDFSNQLCSLLDKSCIDYLYDDLDDGPGVKFSRADLLGIPKQVIIGSKNAREGKIEIKDRKNGEVKVLDFNQFCNYLNSL
ncbi:MAG: proline--tRNA ligase [Candidatus Midichloria sp.]|nr:MAG: proline--tRNA ligase [Candidatus Midichloria sp.]